jgi:predicted Zn-ribbon and HTH transcriptional regulator
MRETPRICHLSPISTTGENAAWELDLDHWLKRQPGRCRSCGYHVATQSHHPTCKQGTEA